ncbi:helix-turn-helix transcriptional regulator [Pseudarthrobacter sp. J1738]|uniref:helix-turn-helix transcriptional regulator n=1 Tax=Pseudarthrobacter sp. J1738 TaxID=3420446 RepID=UPI003D2A0952
METNKALKPAAVAEWLGITPGALAQMRYLGKGPRFVKIGGRSIRYMESDLMSWIEAQTRQQTGEQVSA